MEFVLLCALGLFEKTMHQNSTKCLTGLEASSVSHRLVDHRLADHRQPWPASSAELAEQLGCWLADHSAFVYISTFKDLF